MFLDRERSPWCLCLCFGRQAWRKITQNCHFECTCASCARTHNKWRWCAGLWFTGVAQVRQSSVDACCCTTHPLHPWQPFLTHQLHRRHPKKWTCLSCAPWFPPPPPIRGTFGAHRPRAPATHLQSVKTLLLCCAATDARLIMVCNGKRARCAVPPKPMQLPGRDSQPPQRRSRVCPRVRGRSGRRGCRNLPSTRKVLTRPPPQRPAPRPRSGRCTAVGAGSAACGGASLRRAHTGLRAAARRSPAGRPPPVCLSASAPPLSAQKQTEVEQSTHTHTHTAPAKGEASEDMAVAQRADRERSARRKH